MNENSLKDMDTAELDQKAMGVLKKYDIDTSFGFDILGLAHSMGFAVASSNRLDDYDGFVLINDSDTPWEQVNSDKLIVFSDRLCYEMKRFVIAHEIGHYIFREEGEPVFAYRERRPAPRSKEEQNLDYFAAALLMPKDSFTARYNAAKEKGFSIDEIITMLSSLFASDKKSVVRRIEELELRG